MKIQTDPSPFKAPNPKRVSDQGGMQTIPLSNRVNDKYNISKTKSGNEPMYEKVQETIEVMEPKVTAK